MKRKTLIKYSIPLIIFISIVVFLMVGLHHDPRKLPSMLINKPLPAIQLSTVNHPKTDLTNASFKGKVVLLNVWATWCVACQEEHPFLMKLKKEGVLIYGIDYKDNRDKAKKYLSALGNPYKKIGFDKQGDTAINLGVYGTPETFIIDKKGIVRYKQIGPVTEKVWKSFMAKIVKQYEA